MTQPSALGFFLGYLPSSETGILVEFLQHLESSGRLEDIAAVVQFLHQDNPETADYRTSQLRFFCSSVVQAVCISEMYIFDSIFEKC